MNPTPKSKKDIGGFTYDEYELTTQVQGFYGIDIDLEFQDHIYDHIIDKLNCVYTDLTSLYTNKLSKTKLTAAEVNRVVIQLSAKHDLNSTVIRSIANHFRSVFNGAYGKDIVHNDGYFLTHNINRITMMVSYTKDNPLGNIRITNEEDRTVIDLIPFNIRVKVCNDLQFDKPYPYSVTIKKSSPGDYVVILNYRNYDDACKESLKEEYEDCVQYYKRLSNTASDKSLDASDRSFAYRNMQKMACSIYKYERIYGLSSDNRPEDLL